MKLRVSVVIGLFIALAAIIITLARGSLYADADFAQSISQFAEVASKIEIISPSSNNDEFTDLSKSFESGLKTSQFIQTELSAITGDTPAIRWTNEHIKSSFKLTQIYTHIQNLDNQLELLYAYTLPDKDLNEETATYYTSQVDEADQNNLRASIVISKYVEIENKRPVFDADSRSQFFFSLTPDTIRSSFSMREPRGRHTFTTPGEGAFDPLAILNNENSNFGEIGEYQHEILVGEKTYVVTVVPRLTQIETLTLEVSIREERSLQTTKFVLVYEQI